MGKLGRAIDALPDDVKDYMVRSQNWHGGGTADLGARGETLDDTEKCIQAQITAACGGDFGVPTLALAGSSAGRDSGGMGTTIEFPNQEAERRCRELIQSPEWRDIGPYYDRLCERFGQDRIVRLIKQRAAATMSNEVETEPEAVTAA